MFSKFKSCECC